MTMVAGTDMRTTRKIWKNKGIVIICLAVAAVTTLAASPGIAFAYTADNPAVPYHCFIDQNGDGKITAADEVEDEEGNLALVPCEVSPGDNAWMMSASALVLVMTPAGLAMFYGGLARQKNAVNTIHMVFITTGVIAVQWVLWGYSLAFGPDATGQGFIGDFSWVGLQNVLHDVPSNAYFGINSDGGRNAIPHQT
ncbi:MAG TPA: ammonium transporter, partial [Nitrososphaera sp.]|nr:ammonium transporter [Nitrososphaera sp.]